MPTNSKRPRFSIDDKIEDISYLINRLPNLIAIYIQSIMKRKLDQVDDLEVAKQAKRRPLSHQDSFREGLFEEPVLNEYKKSYATSEP